MKRRFYYVLAALPLTVSAIASPVLAQARPSIQLTPAQAQRLSHDLIRSSSQDFFEQGQAQLEWEVNYLTKRQQFLEGGLLRISPDLQLQQSPAQFDRPRQLAPTQ